MSLPPSGCTATTPRCRSWPRARRSTGTSGLMSATIGRLAAVIRRRHSITPRATDGSEHPTRHLQGFTGILQADAYSGYNELYDASRAQGPVIAGTVLGPCQAAVLRARGYRRQCAARQERRGDLADRLGGGQAHRCPVRHRARYQRTKRRRAAAGALRNRARRCWRHWKAGCASSALGCRTRPRSPSQSTTCCAAWDRFARFLDDGRICLTNNAAERALRGFALGRKSWLFAGSERGADRAALMATLIQKPPPSILICCFATPRNAIGFSGTC